ncbi:MAG: hypothetical protein ACI3X1_07325 [Eubacteriales bacterium]
MLDGNYVVHHVIQSENGRNLVGYGSDAESEVLFPRADYYVTDKIEYDSDGTPTIYLKDVSNGQEEIGRGRNQEALSVDSRGQQDSSDVSDTGKVQRLQTHDSENSEVQSSISERNTALNNDKQGNLQGVQAEVKTIESENGYTITEATPSAELADNPAHNTTDDDAQYQQRTETLLDREVLEIAANELRTQIDNLTPAEADALEIFQNRLSNLKDLQEKRKVQGALYREQQFGENVDRVKAAQTLNRMHILDEKIKRAEASVLSIEDKQVLKHVLQKARKVVEAQERARGQEIRKRYRDDSRP